MRWLRGAGSVTAIATGTALAVAVTLVLAGCAPLSTADVAMATPTSSSTTSTSAGLVVTGSGWDASGIQGTVPAPGSCHYRTVPGSANVLPDPRCTPGAVDRAVTQDSLSNTVCRRGGYTAVVRPPLSLTAPMKRAIMAAYGIPATDATRYELDHLVELSAGGSSDVRNLWPEPNSDAQRSTRNEYVHNDKDELESRMHDALCRGTMSLTAVQTAMAGDWTSLATQAPAPG